MIEIAIICLLYLVSFVLLFLGVKKSFFLHNKIFPVVFTTLGVSLLILSLFLIYSSNKRVLQKCNSNIVPTPTLIPEKPAVKQTDSDSSLLRRCGEFPEKVYDAAVKKNHFMVASGPYWSPDCRYTAWSFWMSGTSWLGEIPEGVTLGPRQINPYEGVYLYSDRTGEIEKIFQPTVLDSTSTFDSWDGSTKIIFRTSDKQYVYDLDEKTVKEFVSEE